MGHRFAIILLLAMTAGCASSGRVTDLESQWARKDTDVALKLVATEEKLRSTNQRLDQYEKRIDVLESRLKEVRFRVTGNVVQILRRHPDRTENTWKTN